MRDTSPALNASAFTCPFCDAYAAQDWAQTSARFNEFRALNLPDLKVAVCEHCNEITVWMDGSMIHPGGSQGGGPALDGMPDPVRRLYEEARRVAPHSSRSAAALLRLALQVLVDTLEPGSRDLNSKIGLLARRGLNPDVVRAMDVVRVLGNNAVHPGQIQIEEDPSLIPALFALVNLIVEQVIVRAETVDALFAALPEGARLAIDRRNGAPGE